MRNILLFQFLLAVHGLTLDSIESLFEKVNTLFSDQQDNADPNQLDYSDIFNDVTSNKQDEIANIIKAIDDGSESFFSDLITTVTNTFTGELLNTDTLNLYVKRHQHVVWR